MVMGWPDDSRVHKAILNLVLLTWFARYYEDTVLTSMHNNKTYTYLFGGSYVCLLAEIFAKLTFSVSF